MDYIYYRLFKLFRSDTIVKMVFMLILYIPIHWLIRFLIIENYGYKFFLEIREKSYIQLFSIIPMIIIGVSVSSFYSDNRTNRIKDRYGKK